jgi:hypothetical protein
MGSRIELTDSLQVNASTQGHVLGAFFGLGSRCRFLVVSLPFSGDFGFYRCRFLAIPVAVFWR